MTRAREAARLIGNNTFRLDSNNAVGFNSTTPDAMFDINAGLTVAGVITATSFSGTVTTATNVTVADESSDTTCFPVFVTAATGDLAPKSGTNLTFNSSTGTLETTNVTVTGDLTVQGTTTTLDTDLIGVDKVEVGANNSTVGLAVTQSGSGAIIAAYDGTSEVFRVDDGGNIGVGTDNPGQKLHINGSGTTRLQITGGPAATARINFGDLADPDIGMMIYDNADNSLQFVTNANEALRVTSAQKLLINTTSAASSSDSLAPLQIEGDTDADAIAIFGRAADDVSEIAFYENDKSTKLGELQYQQSALNFRHRVGHISFAAGGTTELLRLTTAGLLSIVNDTGKFTAGSSDDLQMYHDGTHSRIVDNRDSGTLRIQADDFKIIDKDAGETMLSAVLDGAVQLYHNNSVRVATTADGVDFSGTGSIKVPVGTTAERPTGVAGDFRYNSTTGGLEGYTTEWGAIAGSGGGSGITTTASAPSANTFVYLDLGAAQYHELALSAGITTISCSNGTVGDSHVVVINQPSSGIATVGFDTYFEFPSGATPAMSEGSSKVDMVSFVVKKAAGAGGTELLASAGINYQ